MALNDDAVFTAAVGYIFTAPPGTAAPTLADLQALDLETFATLAPAWKQIGHTSRDDMPEFGFEGGDFDVKGTWQKKRLREVETGDPAEDSVTLVLQQFDAEALELYYGGNAANPLTEPGVFGVSGEFTPVERALLIVLVDGPRRIGFYAPKTSIRRDDSIDLPVDNFAGLPIKSTFLNMGSRRLYDWISALLQPSGGGTEPDDD